MIVINEERIDEVGITINETIHLYKIRDNNIKYDEFVNYKKLERLNLIKIINDKGTKKYVIRASGNNLLDEMLGKHISSVKSKKKLSKRHVTQIVKNNIDTYRNKWRGLQVGVMGSRKSCEEKLTRWINENPEYSIEDILKAADIYINNFNGNYKYLQQADYFIFKKDGREESSRLSAFIEEINIKQFTDGWTTKLK